MLAGIGWVVALRRRGGGGSGAPDAEEETEDDCRLSILLAERVDMPRGPLAGLGCPAVASDSQYPFGGGLLYLPVKPWNKVLCVLGREGSDGLSFGSGDRMVSRDKGEGWCCAALKVSSRFGGGGGGVGADVCICSSEAGLTALEGLRGRGGGDLTGVSDGPEGRSARGDGLRSFGGLGGSDGDAFRMVAPLVDPGMEPPCRFGGANEDWVGGSSLKSIRSSSISGWLGSCADCPDGMRGGRLGRGVAMFSGDGKSGLIDRRSRCASASISDSDAAMAALSSASSSWTS